jgi:hypothetical protein
MTPETISIGVTLGSKHVFHLRMLSMAEEQERRQQTFGLSETEVQASEYERNVNLLADLSEKMPGGLFENTPEKSEDRKFVKYIEDFDSPAAAVRAFFETQTISKERIAYFAVRAFMVRLTPDIDFF